MKDLVHAFLSFFFPEHCIGCGKEGTVLCALCERTITGHPTALTAGTAALFEYRNPLVKKGIWALKYDHRSALGTYFGNALYREFFKHLARKKEEHNGEIILVPIPSSPRNLKERGYNHAEKIAQGITDAGRMDGFTLPVVTTLLLKAKDTKRQVATDGRGERLKNVRGVFSVRNGNAATGKIVVLIDDVITTGATLREARAALRPWKPRSIIAIAVAH